jgi:hypothetical protein
MWSPTSSSLDCCSCPRTTLTAKFRRTSIAQAGKSTPGGERWFVDEVFLFRGSEKRYVYRAID